MSEHIRPPVKYQATPDYPTYEQAESFAEDFRTGAEGAYQTGERWARYWLARTMDILTTLLKDDIYSVVAFPPAGWEYADPEELEDLEYFRGWILEYHPETESWTLLVSSQEVGIDEFNRLRREYKAG
ncbi:unnamed protein product [marine sediment metagenome]|uniref:Uncharacterized protein n=1 Tax=marine sediment metagenome TaxID=412755 RepID=X1RCD2_9ZZZZ